MCGANEYTALLLHLGIELVPQDRNQESSVERFSFYHPNHGRQQLVLLLRWLAAAVVVAGLLIIFIWVLPAWLTRRPSLTGADRQTAVNNARIGIAAVLAVLGTAGGFAYTIRTYRLSRQGQISDRYIKAIEQLSNENPDIRIGGIYALYQTTRDAPEYRDTAIEVLAAYIRNRAAWSNMQTPTSHIARHVASQAATILPHADIRNALAILRDLVQSVSRKGLDLSHVNLAGADLIEMYLVDAKLTDSNLNGANLGKADMRGANLQRTELAKVQLYGANVTDVRLSRGQISEEALRDVKGRESIQWVEP